jgi:hypothetical protein
MINGNGAGGSIVTNFISRNSTFVDAGFGSDNTGTGSQDAPWASIAKAQTNTLAGWTIVVAPGGYLDEVTNMAVNWYLQPGANVTFNPPTVGFTNTIMGYGNVYCDNNIQYGSGNGYNPQRWNITANLIEADEYNPIQGSGLHPGNAYCGMQYNWNAYQINVNMERSGTLAFTNTDYFICNSTVFYDACCSGMIYNITSYYLYNDTNYVEYGYVWFTTTNASSSVSAKICQPNASNFNIYNYIYFIVNGGQWNVGLTTVTNNTAIGTTCGFGGVTFVNDPIFMGCTNWNTTQPNGTNTVNCFGAYQVLTNIPTKY